MLQMNPDPAGGPFRGVRFGRPSCCRSVLTSGGASMVFGPSTQRARPPTSVLVPSDSCAIGGRAARYLVRWRLQSRTEGETIRRGTPGTGEGLTLSLPGAADRSSGIGDEPIRAVSAQKHATHAPLRTQINRVLRRRAATRPPCIPARRASLAEQWRRCACSARPPTARQCSAVAQHPVRSRSALSAIE